ncbi:MAG TPA: hypothetical protein PLD25_16540 [Chloroflexota bacterium]|nr:hypothetical protein [Chloroflexota bacterium]HUM71694.1 hypothetical protein [Chloroflexota bacterium]
METVISLIPNDEHVTRARQALGSAGIVETKIDVLWQPADVWQRLGGHQKVRGVFKNAAIGALIGLIVGALYGVPAGVFNCKAMNCSVGTSVVLWAIISLYWVAAGGFLGAIIGIDRLEQEFYSYVEGVRRGEALFVVDATADKVSEARRILRQEHGMVIQDIHTGTETK